MGFIKKASVAAVVATAFCGLAGQGGAFAAPPEPVLSDAAVVVGTGTISPGLTTVPTAQTSVKFSAILDVEAGDEGVHAQGGVSFLGSSGGNLETVATGAGSGSLSGAYNGTVNYTRDGNIVLLSGTVSGNGDPNDTLGLVSVCVFAPTSVNPTTSYALLCAVTTNSPDGN